MMFFIALFAGFVSFYFDRDPFWAIICSSAVAYIAQCMPRRNTNQTMVIGSLD